jgi:hypothetical protein
MLVNAEGEVEIARMRKQRVLTKADLRRIEIRNRLFGDDAEERIWKGAGEGRGYCCVPGAPDPPSPRYLRYKGRSR